MPDAKTDRRWAWGGWHDQLITDVLSSCCCCCCCSVALLHWLAKHALDL
jgi:hypothetical protein